MRGLSTCYVRSQKPASPVHICGLPLHLLPGTGFIFGRLIGILFKSAAARPPLAADLHRPRHSGAAAPDAGLASQRHTPDSVNAFSWITQLNQAVFLYVEPCTPSNLRYNISGTRCSMTATRTCDLLRQNAIPLGGQIYFYSIAALSSQPDLTGRR